jgi:hypothetical protein
MFSMIFSSTQISEYDYFVFLVSQTLLEETLCRYQILQDSTNVWTWYLNPVILLFMGCNDPSNKMPIQSYSKIYIGLY